MKPEDAEEYTQALGQVVSGSYRQIVLAKNLGVPEALGLSLEQWVTTRIGGYVRLSIDERREAVKELTEQGMTQREVAEVLGVDEKTIRNDKAAENAAQTLERKAENAENSAQILESKAESSENSAPKKPERDEAKELEQALEQNRKIAASHLFIILGTLALGKGSPAEKATEILDYDPRSFKTTQLEITTELWSEAIKTLQECAKQWKAKHASTRRNNSADSD